LELSFDNTERFNFDIRRSLILSLYISEWGMPQSRKIIKKENDNPIEVYSFPSDKDVSVIRFATIGLSAQNYVDSNESVGHELYFVMGKDLGQASEDEVFDYLLDISIYSFRNCSKFSAETIIPESNLSPKAWKLNSILVDEPRGEHESFESLHIGTQHVEMLWLVPTYETEYHYIKEMGIDKFDLLCDSSVFSVADLSRPAFV
jgi:hypothetical protein